MLFLRSLRARVISVVTNTDHGTGVNQFVLDKGSYYVLPYFRTNASYNDVYGSGSWYANYAIGSTASTHVIGLSGTGLTINSAGSGNTGVAISSLNAPQDYKSVAGKITVANDNTTITVTSGAGAISYDIVTFIIIDDFVSS